MRITVGPLWRQRTTIATVERAEWHQGSEPNIEIPIPQWAIGQDLYCEVSIHGREEWESGTALTVWNQAWESGWYIKRAYHIYTQTDCGTVIHIGPIAQQERLRLSALGPVMWVLYDVRIRVLL
jgi:hypothetical protein